MDVVDKQTRSRMMSGIRAKNTRPELIIRAGLDALGYTIHSHDPAIAGKPDIVLRDLRAAIFINGCFWHHHSCRLFKWPSTRRQFWREKIESNEKRDSHNLYRLKVDGWRVLIVWECAIKDRPADDVNSVIKRIVNWLESNAEFYEISDRKAY